MSRTLHDEHTSALYRLAQTRGIELRPDTPEGAALGAVMSVAGSMDSQYRRAVDYVQYLEQQLDKAKIDYVRVRI